MRYCYQKLLSCVICILIFFASNSQRSFFKSSSFGAQAHYGSFITILPKAEYLRDSYSYFGEISFQRNYKKLWPLDSQFVQWGGGIFFGNTGSKQYVGNMGGAFSFINLPLFYKKNFVTIHQDVMRISQYHVLWPVPQSAIDGNSSGRINQNIGYSGAEKNVPPLDKIPE